MDASQNLKVAKAVNHESIFLEHYSWLLDRALRLTRGSKEEAEDLVQDLYVRLVLSQADMDSSDPQRLQGYLFTALQNLFNDEHRGRGRDPLASLQAADYDLMDIALAVADRSQLLHIRSDRRHGQLSNEVGEKVDSLRISIATVAEAHPAEPSILTTRRRTSVWEFSATQSK